MNDTKSQEVLEAVLTAAEELIKCYKVNGTDIEKAYSNLQQRVKEARA